MGGHNFSLVKLTTAALDRRRAVIDHLRAQMTLQGDSVCKIIEVGPKALHWYCEFEHHRWRKVVAARRHDVTLFSILCLTFVSGAAGSLFAAVWSTVPPTIYGFTALFAFLTLFAILAALISLRSGFDLATLRKDGHAQDAVRALQSYGDSVLLVGVRSIYSVHSTDGDRIASQRLPRDEFGSMNIERFGDITAVNLASQSGAIHGRMLFPPTVFDEASAAMLAIENWFCKPDERMITEVSAH
jgi:hypothetical protein